MPQHLYLVRTSAGFSTDASVMFKRGSWGEAYGISNVDIAALRVDRIRAVDDSSNNLNAFVIIPSAPGSKPTWYPKAPRETQMGKVAWQLLAQCLPSLRVVVVGTHRFLFEYSDRNPNGARQLWYLKDAMDDQGQAQATERVLHKVGWLFFDPPYGTRLDEVIGSMSIKTM
ncbi:hypothetical protein MMC30_005892 [Trapelia coarctata]|nr:hypothetical protein [Trapelia coarctata]